MLGIVVAALVIVVVGALVIWWGRACWRGAWPQQWLLGYRTPFTLKDKGAWVAAHRGAAPLIFIAGAGAILAAFVGAVLGLSGADAFAPAFLGSGVTWLIIWILLGFIPAMTAARSYNRSLAST